MMIRSSSSLTRVLSNLLSTGSFGKPIPSTRAGGRGGAVGGRGLQTSVVLSSAQPPAPEKIEVFVDDIPVQVLPGTTVLQVRTCFCPQISDHYWNV